MNSDYFLSRMALCFSDIFEVLEITLVFLTLLTIESSEDGS